MHQVFRSALFNFEFLRVLGSSPFLGAEINECLEAASRIKDGDAESWYGAWHDMAVKAASMAKGAIMRNDAEAARWAFLRASNYFRASEFFLHCRPDDERILAAAEASVDAFDKACALMDAAVIKLDIPFGELTLPARLYLPPAHQRLADTLLPLVIQTGGFDSTQEELYFYGAAGALPRGYAVLSFDGVGQGLPLRQDKTRLRADWEAVTSGVVDFAVERLASKHGLDTDRIAVYGSSLGGYLALRAAADSRIKACVSCDGPYDLFAVSRSRMPSWFIDGWLGGWLGDGLFNRVVDALAAFSFQMRWEFGHSKWVFGQSSPAGVMRAMQEFTLDEDALARQRCPTLVTGPADSFYFTPEQNAHRIYAGLTSLGPGEKRLWVAEGPSNGGLQAKIGALAVLHHEVFTWLDGQFGIRRSIKS